MSSNGIVEPIFGNLPQTWRLASINYLEESNIAELQTGPFGTMLHASSYVDQGTPVVAVKNIQENRLSHESLVFVGEKDRARLDKYSLLEGDILFGRKGAVDRRALITGKETGWLQGSDCIRLRLDNSRFNSQFMSYVLGSPQYREWILRNAQGATMPSLNQRILKRIPIPFPPLKEQKAIVAVLSAFDDKIELNRQMNATLEEMARALFKSWFVDFDPVRRNMAGGPAQPYDHLFPDELVVDENGRELPMGWQVEPLDKIAHYQNGLALQKYPPEGDEYLPVVKIRELRQGFVDDNSNQASPNIKETCILYDGDAVFSWSGSLLVDLWCGGTGALNQHLFKVTSEQYPKWFYYYWTKHHLDEFQRIAAGKATTMGHIQRSHLSAAFANVPSGEVMEVGTAVIAPLIEQMINSNLESQILASLRDTLLPRLMAGQLRVPTGPEARLLHKEVETSRDQKPGFFTKESS